MHITDTIVVGCGGTGGQLIPPLARLLAYHQNSESRVVLVDGDDYEPHNAARQLVGPTQIGANKATAMAEFCYFQGLSDVEAKPVFADDGLISRLVMESNTPLIIAAVDNDATRRMILQVLAATRQNFMFVSPGNADDSDGTNPIRGNVSWWGRADDQTLGINPALVFPNIERPNDAVPRRGSCALMAPSAPQLITANALAATLTLAIVQNLLDRTLPADASTLYFNGRTFQFTFS